MSTLLVPGLLSGTAALVDRTPTEDEIGAGWIYLVVFLLLVAAVTFLGFSLTKHLRKARSNAERGVFDEDGNTAH